MLKQSHAISEELIEWRRDFHMHPEVGFELHRTSKIVADELEKMGYRVKRGVGKTGVVAEMGEGGKVVAISDVGGAVRNRAGLDIAALDAWVAKTKTVAGFAGNRGGAPGRSGGRLNGTVPSGSGGGSCRGSADGPRSMTNARLSTVRTPSTQATLERTGEPAMRTDESR